ncbi:hypothetical protein [Sutcliffiella deserti]|uniref:hypothetical protein n=1 Tax=Sutcliffiella deserti TaxID=2875501 RepID=UPI001CBF4AC7|nr:hypothetical protein [Sutcliffiella deserti]
MFDVLLIVLAILIMIGIFLIQSAICESQYKSMGLVLPLIFLVFSIIISVPNFEKAFYIQFSLGAFIASLVIFLLYNLVTVALISVYWRRKRLVV